MATKRDPRRDPLASLPALAAQFEADVERVGVWVHGDEASDYVTRSGRAVPSIAKELARVSALIAPDVARIVQGALDAQAAAEQAQASAASASADATTATNTLELVESYATTAAGDAANAAESVDRAEAAATSAGRARDEAVAAMRSIMAELETLRTRVAALEAQR